MNALLAVLPTFALSLALTLVLELAVAGVCRVRRRDMLLVVLVNVLTNPAVVYLDMVCAALLPNGRDLWQIPLEAAAIAAEGWCYARFAHDIRRPWLLASVANIFSYTCGLLLQTLL